MWKKICIWLAQVNLKQIDDNKSNTTDFVSGKGSYADIWPHLAKLCANIFGVLFGAFVFIFVFS